ncbi:NADH-quinone oxidoreductase subunit J [Kitasatospora sp. NPDC058406]|uniref:NADH-quinone oxidoreductase subunit J family protein n=1 Tax=Streptomycetaceae TaxID=2062 RepID=UPI002E79A6B9|nr:NADH-quinone oxidoreductase subunit J [Streptomyces sp. BE303]MED7951666.1 NADH-quinone oxidoreductase subunit J [Streptomyces sp. BE303]
MSAATLLAATGSLDPAARSFLSPTGVEIVFLLVGIAVLGSAVVAVTTKQLVHAALWLVAALGGLAVEFLLLTAEFIAWVQVLIYLGSVVVLVLFGLMLTKAPIGRSPDADSGNRWVALVVALASGGTLVTLVVDAFRTSWIDLGAGGGSAAVTGASLFRTWVLPFEALSVLLLAALVGAIVLSRGGGRRVPVPRAGRIRAGKPVGSNGTVAATAPKAAPAVPAVEAVEAAPAATAAPAVEGAASAPASPPASAPTTPEQEG